MLEQVIGFYKQQLLGQELAENATEAQNATEEAAPIEGGEAADGDMMILPIVLGPAALFDVTQYNASETCQVQQMNEMFMTNDTICCDNINIGQNGTQFCGSLNAMGIDYAKDQDWICGNFSLIYQNCTDSTALINNADSLID